MNYKLINKQTGEETLCDKVTIDGFDYYVNDDEIKVGDYYLTFTNKTVMGNVRRCEDSSYNFNHCKKVICTNNSNIDDVPNVVDEVEVFYKEHKKSFIWEPAKESIFHFKAGYNKHAETHPFSEEDMIEFAEWTSLNMSITPKKRTWYRYADKTDELAAYTTKELLQLWKEQKPKIVYYD